MAKKYITLKKGISWSQATFTLAAWIAAIVALEVVTGEVGGKYPNAPRTIARMEHLAWFSVPLVLCFIGWLIRVRENPR